MEALNFFAIGLSVLIFLASGKIVESVATVHIVNWLILAYSTVGIVAAAAIVIILVYKLDKEKVTI